MFSYRAESDKMFFTMTTLVVLIFAVRTKAQRFSSPSLQKQCRKVLAFHSILLRCTIWSHQDIYKKWSFPLLWRGKANNVILSNGCSFYISLWCAKCCMLLLPPEVLWIIVIDSRRREIHFQSKFCWLVCGNVDQKILIRKRAVWFPLLT